MPIIHSEVEPTYNNVGKKEHASTISIVVSASRFAVTKTKCVLLLLMLASASVIARINAQPTLEDCREVLKSKDRRSPISSASEFFCIRKRMLPRGTSFSHLCRFEKGEPVEIINLPRQISTNIPKIVYLARDVTGGFYETAGTGYQLIQSSNPSYLYVSQSTLDVFDKFFRDGAEIGFRSVELIKDLVTYTGVFIYNNNIQDENIKALAMPGLEIIQMCLESIACSEMWSYKGTILKVKRKLIDSGVSEMYFEKVEMQLNSTVSKNRANENISQATCRLV